MNAKHLIITASVIGVAGLGTLIGTTAVLANDTGDTAPPIVQKIADAFNLDADEVAAVFEQDRTERKEDRLDKLVENEVITEDQRSLIEEKMAEFEDELESIRNQDLTMDERHEAMELLHEQMRTWAEENDLPVMPFGGLGGPGEMRGFGGHGMHGAGMNGEGSSNGDCLNTE